jgi:hypothetical protein
MNASRNNPAALTHDPDYLAHRMLFMADYVSAPHHTTADTYLWAEQGEPVIEVNGRPLTTIEPRELDLGRIGEVDWAECQPATLKLKIGVATILPEYTVWRLSCGEDCLVTVGCIVEREQVDVEVEVLGDPVLDLTSIW